MQSILLAEKIEYTETAKNDSGPIAKVPYNPKNDLASLKLIEKKLIQDFLSKQYKQAKSDLKKKESPRSLFALAENYFTKRVYSSAKPKYKKILAYDDKFLPAYQRLILISLIEGDLPATLQYHKQLLSATNRRADFLHSYILFNVSFFGNDKNVTDEVLSDLKELIQKEPKNALYENTYGWVLLNFIGNLQEAKTHFEKALAIDSNFIHSLNNLGVCFLKEKDYPNAEKYFDLAIKTNSKFPLAFENLSSSYISQKDFFSAIKPLQKALNAKVAISENWQHIFGWLLIQTGQLEEAKAWYKDRIKQEPQNNLLVNNLGRCYALTGGRAIAKLHFETAVSMVRQKLRNKKPVDIRSLVAFYNLARVSIEEGNRQKVEEIYNTIVRLNPKDNFALYLLGNMSLVKGNMENAVKYYTECLTENEYLADAYADLSFILECFYKDYKSSIQLLEKAVKLGIRLPLIDNNLAYAYINDGDLTRAEKILDQDAENKRPEFIATKGMLAFRKGNITEGDKLYQLAIAQIRPSLKSLATQIWRYEQGLYWFTQKDFDKARAALKLARQEVKSYMLTDITNLEKKIMELDGVKFS